MKRRMQNVLQRLWCSHLTCEGRGEAWFERLEPSGTAASTDDGAEGPTGQSKTHFWAALTTLRFLGVCVYFVGPTMEVNEHNHV